MDYRTIDMAPRKMAEDDLREAKKERRKKMKENLTVIVLLLLFAAFFAFNGGDRIADFITRYVFK